MVNPPRIAIIAPQHISVNTKVRELIFFLFGRARKNEQFKKNQLNSIYSFL